MVYLKSRESKPMNLMINQNAKPASCVGTIFFIIQFTIASDEFIFLKGVK